MCDATQKKPPMKLVILFPVAALCVTRLVAAFMGMRVHEHYITTHRAELLQQADSLLALACHEVSHQGGDGVDPSLQKVHLNAAESASVLIDLEAMERHGWDEARLYDLYRCLGEMLGYNHSTTGDVWNCTCAFVSWKLRALCDSSQSLESDDNRSSALAVAHLLLRHPPPAPQHQCSQGELLLQLNPSLVNDAEEAYRRESSGWRGVSLFLRAVTACCRGPRMTLLVLLACLPAQAVRQLLPGHSFVAESLCVSELVQQQTAARRGTLFSRFVRQMMSSATGKLLATSMLFGVFSDLAYTMRNLARSEVLFEFNMSLKVAAVSSLARSDYMSTSSWKLPLDTMTALSCATDCTFDDAEVLLDDAISWLNVLVAVARFPVACVAGGVTQYVQGTTERQWTRVMQEERMATGTLQRRSLSHSAGACSNEPVEKPQSLGVNASNGAHFGLTLWLSLLKKTSATARTVARHTRWPTHPFPALQMSLLTSTLLLDDDVDRQLKDDVSALHSTSTFVAAQTSQSTAEYWSMLRHGGLEERALAVSHPPPHSTGEDAEQLGGKLVSSALTTTRSAPLVVVTGVLASTAVPMAPSEGTGTSQRAAVEELYEAISFMESVGTSPWFITFQHVSSHHWDVMEAQSRYYRGSPFYSGMTFLQRLAHASPSIDCRLWQQCVPLASGPWKVELRDVTFRYPGARVLSLDRVTFTVPRGGFLGIVGYSGAGKTTLLLLLSRVYTPESGCILVNDLPISVYAPRTLRRHIAHAWQEQNDMRFFSSMTIAANIALGDLLHANANHVSAALAQAQAHTFVNERAHGQQASLHCDEFSGGELERLSIARCLIKRPSRAGVYIFDESTSALDSSTEEAILGTLGLTTSRAARGQATVIMASHRLASLQCATIIIVMSGGRVVEQGSWKELLHLPPDSVFHQLLTSQFARASA